MPSSTCSFCRVLLCFYSAASLYGKQAGVQARLEYSQDTSTMPFAPTWAAEAPKDAANGYAESAACFEGSPYRAAPFPHNGGFCYFKGLTADAVSRRFILPPDLVVTRPSPDEASMWSMILGTGRSPFEEDRVPQSGVLKKLNPMRGGLQWTNATSAADPRLCRNRDQGAARRPVVLLTPWNNPSSLKHWAVSSFAAFSLQRHLEKAFGLRSLTHVIDRQVEPSCPWVNTTRNLLLSELAKTGVETLDDIPFAKDKEVPPWATGCFDAVMVAIGAGHTYDPTWLLDRNDALALRTLYARAIRKELPNSVNFGRRKSDAQSLEALVTRAYPEGDPDVEKSLLETSFTASEQALSITILQRSKRNIGNIDELAQALEAQDPAKASEGRVKCGLFGGECDRQWRAKDVVKLRMESLSALEQVRPMLSSHVFVVPHGAGNTHGTVMPPCSLVVEVLPFNYPQLSFITPLTSSGHMFLQLYETTPTGNLIMVESRFNDLCRKKLGITDNRTAFADVPGFKCIYCKKCETTAKKRPVMNVSIDLFLQLMDHGAHLRRRCLANYPHTEFLDHRASILKAGQTYFRREQKPMAPQEVWRYHFNITTVASSRRPLGEATLARGAPPSCLAQYPHERAGMMPHCSLYPPTERSVSELQPLYNSVRDFYYQGAVNNFSPLKKNTAAKEGKKGYYSSRTKHKIVKRVTAKRRKYNTEDGGLNIISRDPAAPVDKEAIRQIRADKEAIAETKAKAKSHAVRRTRRSGTATSKSSSSSSKDPRDPMKDLQG